MSTNPKLPSKVAGLDWSPMTVNKLIDAVTLNPQAVADYVAALENECNRLYTRINSFGNEYVLVTQAALNNLKSTFESDTASHVSQRIPRHSVFTNPPQPLSRYTIEPRIASEEWIKPADDSLQATAPLMPSSTKSEHNSEDFNPRRASNVSQQSQPSVKSHNENSALFPAPVNTQGMTKGRDGLYDDFHAFLVGKMEKDKRVTKEKVAALNAKIPEILMPTQTHTTHQPLEGVPHITGFFNRPEDLVQSDTSRAQLFHCTYPVLELKAMATNKPVTKCLQQLIDELYIARRGPGSPANRPKKSKNPVLTSTTPDSGATLNIRFPPGHARLMVPTKAPRHDSRR